MIFAEIAVSEAAGALLAHSVHAEGVRFKKGRALSQEDVAALERAGVTHVLAARLEPGDVPEDEAAAKLAEALAGPGTDAAAPFTGRANLFAESGGVLMLDRDRLDRINLIDESLTVATLAPYEQVIGRQMLATVKVIPFACPRSVLDRAIAIAREAAPLLQVARFKPMRLGLVATRLPGTKESVLDKTRKVLDTRLEPLGSGIAQEVRCGHDEKAVAHAVGTLVDQGLGPILIVGASAIVDRRDIVPAGIERAGGELLHFGMPVDPGNLLLLARHGDTPVLGLPGCARSPKLNGVDWVLQRLLAGVAVGPEDIMRMGAGGLLKEIPSRPQPRAGTVTKPAAARIAALVLAAGQSRRMGDVNKLLADIDGAPMVARVVDRVLESRAGPVIVVTGHEAERVERALAGRDVTFVRNLDYAQGLSASLKTGIAALPPADGALVCLADMPDVATSDLDRLIAAFDPDEGRSICVPTVGGKRGNPVLWSSEFFEEMQALKGDVGAKHLIGEHADEVCEVPLDGRGALADIDTPEALAERSGG